MSNPAPSSATNTTTANTTTGPTASTNSSQKVELGLLEEDDEFEEFETEDWNENEKDVESEPNLWEDNWDDDNVEDDFTLQLRAELEKRGQKLEI
jgi:26 proteasome complex subunit DSS1